MRSYNDIGIDGSLDWARIRKLMVIGLLAGCVPFAALLIAWICTLL